MTARTVQLTLRSDEKVFRISFDRGAVMAASSPLAADSATRVALASHLIAPAQVRDLERRIAAAPGADEIDVIVAAARLSPEQARVLRRRLVARRAARTFAVERGSYELEERTPLPVAQEGVDVRGVIYAGARTHLSELRLALDLRRFGTRFALKPDLLDELPRYGFTRAERPVLEALRRGTSLPELEANQRELDPRIARAVIYALASCNALLPAEALANGTGAMPPITVPVPVPRDLTTIGSQPPRPPAPPQPAAGPARAKTRTVPPRPKSWTVPARAKTRTMPPRAKSLTVPRPRSQTASPPVPVLPPAPPVLSPAPPVLPPVLPAAARPRGAAVPPPIPSRPPPVPARLSPPVRTGTGDEPPMPRGFRPASEPRPGDSEVTPLPRSMLDSFRTNRTTTVRPNALAVHEVMKLIEQRTALLDRGADHFTLLGLPIGAPPEDVHAAYVELSRNLRPMRLAELGISDDSFAAQRLLAQIGIAYTVLTDRILRP
ncbi:MAG TPA: hypothetical protein VK932_21865, partial [Kofleriaceae bacterium]|nr:hypothetical protein [Kofleriaceae bacterium]